ncbi:hypothetical protein D3C83_40660 [compost metagenome]
MRQLTTQRALDDRFLEATDGGIELLRRDWSLANELIENVRGNGRERRVRHQGFASAGHKDSSCYAPHTKFLTVSELHEFLRERGVAHRDGIF